MPIDGYTTKIDAAQTVGEIGALLAKFGARRIMTEYGDGGRPTGVTFEIPTDTGDATFALPVRVAGVQATLERDKVQPQYRTMEHAEKVAWRIALVWLRAQLALIDTKMVSLDEVMFPWMVGGGGQTLHAVYRERGLRALGS